MRSVKRLMLNTLLLPSFPATLKYVQRQCATIFMLHRFEDSDRDVCGCSPSNLRSALKYLAKNRYEFVSLSEMFRRLAGSERDPCGAVAFTIDDGYLDQATVAAPIFAEFNCPVTTFVATGFLDGKVWFWWDQIEYIFEHANKKSVEIQLGGEILSFRWTDNDQRKQVQDKFTQLCKRVANSEKLAGIARLAQQMDVAIPNSAPAKSLPMSWEQARKCEEMGMSFGPHTVTHPVLGRATSTEMAYEIQESWTRLCAEVKNPIPVFCYPNGGLEDFGEREIGVLRQLGFLGAVVGEPGYANSRVFRTHTDNPFKVPRFSLPDEMPHLVQYVSGVERFKQILRRGT